MIFQSYLSPIQTINAIEDNIRVTQISILPQSNSNCPTTPAPGGTGAFQSYLSPIQTGSSPRHLSSRLSFQSYLSPIQTVPPDCALYARTDFNPTLVQFKQNLARTFCCWFWRISILPQSNSNQGRFVLPTKQREYFNPTLVQFKPVRDCFCHDCICHFNPTLVQFKPPQEKIQEKKEKKFQSYLSPIQTNRLDVWDRFSVTFQSYLSPIQTGGEVWVYDADGRISILPQSNSNFAFL